MILRKPYAFFIKIFKPMHLLLAIITAYLIYLDNKILNFLNMYVSSNVDVIGQQIKKNLGSSLLYIIPIIIIVFSLIILGLMYRKKKPFKFYIINIFTFILIIVINLYAVNFLGILENNIVSVRSVKLIHDIVLINMLIEGASFIFFAIRGIGLNFKSFDFNSDLSKMNISEVDKEEFELDINIDLSESKRKRKRAFRHLKYTYIEHKFLINCILVIFICVISLSIYGAINVYTKNNREGTIYSAGTFNFGVEKSVIVSHNFLGEDINIKYDMIVLYVKLQSNANDSSVFLEDFKLKVGDVTYKPTTRYYSSLIDLGKGYNGETLDSEYKTYLFVYRVSKGQTNNKMQFKYNLEGKSITINLKPQILEEKELNVSKTLNEEISFIDTYGDIKFNISNYEISDMFTINYDYCIKSNDCIKSKEYLKPTINENFDKTLLKLNITYTNNSHVEAPTFYEFLAKYGIVSYNINGIWYEQLTNFENVKSAKQPQNNIIYIGVNSDIEKASSIKITFKVRNSNYEYILK